MELTCGIIIGLMFGIIIVLTCIAIDDYIQLIVRTSGKEVQREIETRK